MTLEAKEQIFQTVYVSSASELIEEPRMLEMLEEWQINNSRLGITGMMLYSQGEHFTGTGGRKSKH